MYFEIKLAALYKSNSRHLPNTAINIYLSRLCLHPLNHHLNIKETFMCHSVALLQHARFNPWQCYTPYFQSVYFKKKLTPCCDLPKQSTFLCTYSAYYAPTLKPWRPPTPIMTLSNCPDEFRCFNSQMQLSHADRIINSRKQKTTWPSIDSKQITQIKKTGPQVRIQISKLMLIRGNAATCPDVHGATQLGPQPVFPSTMRIKPDNRIDYISCNSTQKKKDKSLTHTFNSVYTAHFITRRKIYFIWFKEHLNFILHEETKSHFLHIAICIKTNICMYSSFIV
jgi:hypothetical protein